MRQLLPTEEYGVAPCQSQLPSLPALLVPLTGRSETIDAPGEVPGVGQQDDKGHDRVVVDMWLDRARLARARVIHNVFRLWIDHVTLRQLAPHESVSPSHGVHQTLIERRTVGPPC